MLQSQKSSASLKKTPVTVFPLTPEDLDDIRAIRAGLQEKGGTPWSEIKRQYGLK